MELISPFAYNVGRQLSRNAFPKLRLIKTTKETGTGLLGTKRGENPSKKNQSSLSRDVDRICMWRVVKLVSNLPNVFGLTRD